MTIDNLCNSCTNIGCEFQSGIIRTKCAFYMPPQLEPDNCGNYVIQDSTTKNNLEVLDKIRAEILELDDAADYDYEGYYKAVTDAVQIIDKYKAESEGKE